MTPHPPGQCELATFRRADFQFLSETIRQRTGIVIGESKRDMVYGRIRRRLKALDIGSIGDYCSLIKSTAGAAEIANLVNAITTNHTNFFRESHHFDHLQKVSLPYWRRSIAGRQPRRLRIWSAGCATGEEPYSIAMALHAVVGGDTGWDARILATDIDTNALETARRGIYLKENVKRVPANIRFNSFIAAGQEGCRTMVQVTPVLHRCIAFRQLNLLGAWPMKGPFNAIFCRNVMIYFDRRTQTNLVERFLSLLAPGGWLFIGHSESGAVNGQNLEIAGRTIFRKAP